MWIVAPIPKGKKQDIGKHLTHQTLNIYLNILSRFCNLMNMVMDHRSQFNPFKKKNICIGKTNYLIYIPPERLTGQKKTDMIFGFCFIKSLFNIIINNLICCYSIYRIRLKSFRLVLAGLVNILQYLYHSKRWNTEI